MATYDELAQGLDPQAPEQTPAPANEYDAMLTSLDQQKRQTLQQTFVSTADQTPDQAAEAHKLSQSTDIPVTIVSRNLDDVRKRAAAEATPYDEMLKDTPKLADWVIQHPTVAPVVKDDLEKLGFLDWLMQAPKRAWTQGQAQNRVGELKYQSLFRDLTPAEQSQLEADRTASQDGGKLGAGNSWFRGAITGSAQTLPTMIGAWLYGAKRGIPAGVAAGTAAAAVDWAAGGPVGEAIGTPVAFAGGFTAGMMTGSGEFMMRQGAGLAYDDYSKMRDEYGQPLDTGVAKAAALGAGVIQAGLAGVGTEFMLKSIPGFDKLVGLAGQNAVKAALKSPTVRAALGRAIAGYATNLTAQSAVMVGMRAATILGGAIAEATGKTAPVDGQVVPGNVNLYQQPRVPNADGSISTVDSVSINIDGNEVLIPRVTPDGRHLTTEQAIAEYKTTGRNLGTFKTPEQANKFAESLHNDYAAGVYDKSGPIPSPQEVGSDLWHEFMNAMQSFALISLPGALGQLAEGTMRARSAAANVKFFQAIGEGVAQSKTTERLPEAMQSFMQSVTDDGPVSHVYADADVWTKYWQDRGLDPAQVAAEVTGSRDAYDQAVNTGGQLEIPTARYAVKMAPTEHNTFWVNELRLSPDQMNGREATAFQDQVRQMAAAPEASSAAEIHANIVQQLRATGYAPDAAESVAQLYESAFTSLAERAGMDPLEVYQAYGLNVSRPASAAPERETQPATGALPLATPFTNEAGALETPGAGSAGGPETGQPAAAGAEGQPAPKPAEAPQATPGEAPPAAGALTGPATPHDVARATTAAIDPLQVNPDAATLAGDGSQVRSPERQAGHVGTESVVPNPGAANAAPGRGDQLPGAAPERGAAAALGAGSAGREAGGAGESRTVKLPPTYEPKFAVLADGARRLGFAGSDDQLATAFRDKLDQARTIARDLNAIDEESGDSSSELLKAISQAGGLGIEAEGEQGMRGELEHMLESLNRQTGKIRKGARAGKLLPKAFRRSGGLPGIPGIIVRSGGRPMDTIFEAIQEDPRWANKFDSMSDFLSAVDDAIRIEVGTSEAPGSNKFPVDDILTKFLDVRPESTWWAGEGQLENNGSGESAASLEAIHRDASMKARGEQFVVYDKSGNRRVLIGPDAVDYQVQPGESYGVEGPDGFRLLDDRGGKPPAPNVANMLHEDAILNADLQGPDAGDTSFDISEFDQGLFDELSNDPNAGVDILATGEKQPRLPGAENVREQEVVQPPIADVKDEFRLTPPEETAHTQTTLFQSQPLTDAFLEQWAGDLQARTGPDLVDLELGLRFDGAIEIAQLGIRRGGTRAGVGTAVMREIVRLADQHGARLVLRVAESGYATESGSAASEGIDALQRFYKRFGFTVAGTDEHGLTMLERDPTVKLGRQGLAWRTPRKTLAELNAAGFDTSTPYYHQTAEANVEPITREGFDLTKGRARLSDEQVPDGVFFKPEPNDIGVGASGVGEDRAAQIPVYLRMGKAEYFSDRNALEAWAGALDPEYKRMVAETKQHDHARSKEFDVLWNRLRELDAKNTDERAQHKADLQIDQFLETWKAENVANATAARARLTEMLKSRGVETVVIDHDKGSFGRVTKTVIAIGGEQVAHAAPGDERMLFQPFHHGSPHSFDRFSTSKIGTGERAQAYGWGLYFAENPKVAEEYRKQLADLTGRPRIYVNGKEIEEGPERHGASLIAHNDVREIRAAAKRWLVEAENGEPGVTDTARLAGLSAVDYWTRLKAFVDGHGRRDVRVERGHTYTVDIPDEHIEKMLNLDAPLAKQTDTIKAAVAVKLRVLGYLAADDTGPRQLTSAWKAYVMAHAGMGEGDTGHTIYDSLFNGKNAAEAASKELLALGVPGATYFDEGSRAKRGGRRTRNVIAYDDSIVTITHKNGTPVSAEERAAIVHEMGQGGTGNMPQEDRGGRRGFIRFGADRQFNIGLLEKADLSTFLHETGHFYLEVFGDLVDQVKKLADDQQSPAQRQLVADYGTLLGWMGAKDRAGVDEAAHEQFARGFEAYLMEGKAPSIELRSAFARFRSWLVAIYKSVSSLKVQLTPDVTRVLNRMLATDKAIFAAEQEGHVAPMFTTAESAGYTETQFGLYRAAVAEASRATREKLERRVLGEVQREQQAEWKRRREEIRGQVEKDVHDRPVYQALAAMQHGTRPDGTPLLEETTSEPVKLSRAALVDQFGRDRLDRLPKPKIWTSEGGADPEVVARMFGFTSADDMLTQLERAAPAKAVIDHETTQRMVAEHGSILLDGTLMERAREAVATDQREALIRAELHALAHLRTIAAPFIKAGNEQLKLSQRERDYERRWFDAERKLAVAVQKKAAGAQIRDLQNQVRELRAAARGGAATIRAAIPPPALIAETARQTLAATRVRDLTPARYWSASRQARQRALDAAARQDFGGAITAAQQELVNTHLYRQASDLRDAIEQRVKTIRQQATSKGLQMLGKAGGGFLEQYQGILDRYSFTPASGPQLERRASLRAWVEERDAAGMPVDLPDNVLDEVQRVPYQMLTTEEFAGVADALDNIAHAARNENRLLAKQLRETVDAAAGEMADSIRAEFTASGRQPPVVSRDRSEGRASRTLAGYVGAHVRLGDWLRQLDGGKDGGPLQMLIGAPINDAGAREAAMLTDSAETRAKLIEAAYPRSRKRELYAKVYVEAVGQSLSKMERIAISMLNWGNEGNRDRIRMSEKWSDAQVDAIRATLSREDLTFAQGVLDHVNSFKPEIVAKQKRVYGVEPVMVDPLPIQTEHGEFPGGYYPLKFDDRLSANMASKVDAGAIANLAAYTRATTLRNHLKERLKNVKEPVRRDFSVVDQHLQQVIHDLTHHEMLIDTMRLINHPLVRQAIFDTHGDLVHKEILKAIRDVAVGLLPPANAVEDAFGWARTGASIAMVGYNLTTPLVHGAGAFPKLFGERLGPQWVAKGLARWARGPEFAESTAKWIDDVSPTMANRRATWNRDLPQLRRDYGASTGRFSGWVEEAVHHLSLGVVEKQQLVDGYFYLVGKLQQTADTVGFLGAYEKALAGGEAHDQAVKIADQAVLGIFGGGQVKDLPPIMRGGPFMKMWTVFYGPFNSTFNLLRESKRAARLSSPASIPRLAADVLVYVTVPATLVAAIRGRFNQCAEGDSVCYAKELGMAHAGYLADLLVGTREMAGALQGYHGYEGPAGASFFNDTGKIIERFYNTGSKLAAGKPAAEALDDKFWLELDDVAGLAFHYPAAQIRKTIAGIEALERGDTTNPLAVIMGPPPAKK